MAREYTVCGGMPGAKHPMPVLPFSTFPRRNGFQVMESVAGEIACYCILTYISLKMEMHWRSKPVGKVRKNLPFFKEFIYEYFTKKT
jgi:hypothetical protein